MDELWVDNDALLDGVVDVDEERRGEVMKR